MNLDWFNWASFALGYAACVASIVLTVYIGIFFKNGGSGD